MALIVNLVGARPQFVKAGPVSKALAGAGAKEILVHTGQHYDPLMSERIMEAVGLREPDLNLGVGSASHGEQTARMLEGVERMLLDTAPDALLTYGDTNSTIAGALAAAKLGIFTAHVEAGLRSFNRSMPEELNRVATDHLSDLLLCPTDTAMGHLDREGLADRSVLTGDVMVDALQSIDFDQVETPEWVTGTFYTATVHRAENTEDRARFAELVKALSAMEHDVHLLAHPRLDPLLEELGVGHGEGSLVVHEPLPYPEMLATMKTSSGLLTDSGGLQKEAFILQVPCVTLRGETEWPETLQGNWNVLAGDRLDQLDDLMTRPTTPVSAHPFGDGRAASRVVDAVLDAL